MSLFRRKRRTATNNVPVNSYEEAEANPELIAAEEQVNQLPSSASLLNPSIATPSGADQGLAESSKDEGSSED